MFYYFGRKITMMREAKIVAQKANFVLNFLPYVRIKEKGILVSNRYLDVNIGK